MDNISIAYLNSKIWYRALKVLSLCLFIVTQVFAYKIVSEKLSTKIVSEKTFKQVGKIEKIRNSSSSNLTDEVAGKKVYNEDRYGNWIEYSSKPQLIDASRRKQLDGIVIDMERQNASQRDVQIIVDDFKNKYGEKINIEYTDEYSLMEKIGARVLTFVGIITAFYIVGLVFYYIVTGKIKLNK